MGRQFIAVVPQGLSENAELKKLVGKLKKTLEARSQEARWTPPQLWHVTLQFLGELSTSERKDELIEALKNWRPENKAMELRLQGLGAFPDNTQGRVLWIGVQESQELIDLQKDLVRHLAEHNFSVGEREFKAHLTLARFRNTIHVDDLVKLGGRKHFGDYMLSEVILFESVLQGNIMKYIPQWRGSLSDSDSAQSE